ncbi:SLC13 family permease [Clostridium sp. AN503]|uniref:SLC13 family permease n=1 Tax=Clostridium sp. AN503 TaxID=3160598 RepID=UPI00345B41C3
MKQKRNMYLIHCLIGISIMLLFRWLPFDMPKITDLGKQILGIFVGTLYLWTTVDLVWSSVICIFMIGATAYAPMPAVLSSAFGNPTVVQLFFLMILMSSLQTRRISLYIGRFFLTRKFIIGRPWAFTAVLFVGSMLIAAFVGCYAPIFLFWPILYDVFEEVGMERHEAYPTIMIILIVVACTLGFPVPPYMNNGLAMISNYATVSQNLLGTSVIINNAEWLAVALIYGFCSLRRRHPVHQIRPVSRCEQAKESDAGAVKQKSSAAHEQTAESRFGNLCRLSPEYAFAQHLSDVSRHGMAPRQRHRHVAAVFCHYLCCKN